MRWHVSRLPGPLVDRLLTLVNKGIKYTPKISTRVVERKIIDDWQKRTVVKRKPILMVVNRERKVI